MTGCRSNLRLHVTVTLLSGGASPGRGLQAGYGVVAADNGRKGIRMASAHRPDLVVTDIVMPDIEGIGAIRAIKQGARPPKIIAISGAGRTRGADYLSWAKHLGRTRFSPSPSACPSS